MPQVPEWEEIATTIFEHGEQAIRRAKTVDQTLASLDQDVNAMLEKRRYLLLAGPETEIVRLRRAPRSRMPSDVGRAAWLFLAPALLLIFIFFFLPVLASLVLSVTDFDIYAIANPPTTRFVGLANYVKLLHDPEFWKALRNTFYFALVGGPLTIAVIARRRAAPEREAGAIQELLPHDLLRAVRDDARRGRDRLALPLPPAVRPAQLRARRTSASRPIDWLGDPHWAMPAIILMAVWKNFGYNMLIFIAGLQAIPQELYDAAEIDGAGPVRRFFAHHAADARRRRCFFVGVITMIGYFQLFSEPYVMTQGGPLARDDERRALMYEEGFRWWRMGYAAAIAFVLFIVILLATLIQFRLQKEHV